MAYVQNWKTNIEVEKHQTYEHLTSSVEEFILTSIDRYKYGMEKNLITQPIVSKDTDQFSVFIAETRCQLN